MNDRSVHTDWGEIRFSGSSKALAFQEIKDGIYEILYMRVINSKYVSQTYSICVSTDSKQCVSLKNYLVQFE